MKKIIAIALSLVLILTIFDQTVLTAVAAEPPTITCESKECFAGDTITIDVNISNNPGIMYLELTPTYSSELGTPTIDNGDIFSDITNGKQLIWTANEDVNANGKLVSFTFSINQSVKAGTYSFGFTFRSSYNYDEDSVSFDIIPATISVFSNSSNTVENLFKEGESQVRSKGASRYDTALVTADNLKTALSINEFGTIIIACGTNFPDALAGSYLAAKKSAPILIVGGGASASGAAEAVNYVSENLASGGTVYILGGTGAVAQSVEDSLNALKSASFTLDVKRLKDTDRYGTNMKILNEAGLDGVDTLLICDGAGFADALSASALGLPILLINKKTSHLTQAQMDYIAAGGFKEIYILGGTGVVPESIVSDVKAVADSAENIKRLSGKGRYDTSIAIAEKFFPETDCITIATGVNFPDGLTGGSLAYTLGAPLILTTNTEAAISLANGFVQKNGADKILTFGGTAAIKDETVNEIIKPEVKEVKAGLICIHDESSTYDLGFINAFKEACDAAGISYVIKKNVSESYDCYDAIEYLIENEDCNFIFADSFGHEPYMLQAAKEYSDVYFAHATGTQAHTAGLGNFGNAFASIYEGRFLAGVAAGLKINEMIKAGTINADQAKVGYVAAYNYAEVISSYTAFFLGVRYVCPTATMDVSFTASWYDEDAEYAAANSLINGGCVLISQHSDSMGAPRACEERGVPNVSYNGATDAVGPNTFIVSSRINWTPCFSYYIGRIATGKKIAADYTGSLADGSVELSYLGKAAADGTADVLEDVKAKLIDGSLHVFDTSTFTVGGQTLTSYLADVDDYGDYVGDTEVVFGGYFHESEYRSAPYFAIEIDGINLLGN